MAIDRNKHSAQSIDIANVEVKRHLRGAFLFTEFLKLAHNLNPYEITYIENVSEQRFQEFFLRLGFVKAINPQCFYLSTKIKI